VVVTLGLLVAALIAVIVWRAMPSRTATGRAVWAQTVGFRQYLATAEAEQLRHEEAASVFGRYLPLAMIFGLTRRWAAVFAALAAAALLVVALRAGDALPRWTVAVALVGLLVGGAGARAPHGGALDWLVPAALRAGEYLFVAGVGVACAVPAPLVFALVLALALHHYDVTARMEKGAPDPVVRLRPGWDVVVVLLTLAAAAGWATGGTIVLAGLAGGAFVVSALAGRRTAQVEGAPR
jgi:hypothetical protein